MSERLHELLADKALRQLDPADVPELVRLLESDADVDPGEYRRLLDDLDVVLTRPRRRARLLHRFGWVEWAVAATIVLGCLVVVRVAIPNDGADQRRLAVERSQLLDDADGYLPWVARAGASRPLIPGDVVWNGRQGYLRFEGLAENDPRIIRYRLYVETASGDVYLAATFDAHKRPGDWIVPFQLSSPDAVAFRVTAESVGEGETQRHVASTRP